MSFQFFLLQDQPMGAVSVFTVGNYLNQPFRDVLCFAWCCCFLLCVCSSNELVETIFLVILGSIWRQIPIGLDLTSVCCWDAESGFRTNESCENRRHTIVLKYWRASSRSRRWFLCLSLRESLLDCSKMVSRRCRLQSMVVQEII